MGERLCCRAAVLLLCCAAAWLLRTAATACACPSGQGLGRVHVLHSRGRRSPPCSRPLRPAPTLIPHRRLPPCPALQQAHYPVSGWRCGACGAGQCKFLCCTVVPCCSCCLLPPQLLALLALALLFHRRPCMAGPRGGMAAPALQHTPRLPARSRCLPPCLPCSPLFPPFPRTASLPLLSTGALQVV